MNAPIIYRRATVTDVETVAELYLQFSIKIHAIEKTALQENRKDDYIEMANETLQNELITTLLAFAENAAVGFADWYEIPAKKILFLDDLFVLDEYAGKGIGTALMKKFEEEAQRNDMQMKLEVNEWNTHALELYKRRGYKDDGIVMVKESTSV